MKREHGVSIEAAFVSAARMKLTPDAFTDLMEDAKALIEGRE